MLFPAMALAYVNAPPATSPATLRQWRARLRFHAVGDRMPLGGLYTDHGDGREDGYYAMLADRWQFDVRALYVVSFGQLARVRALRGLSEPGVMRALDLPVYSLEWLSVDRPLTTDRYCGISLREYLSRP